MDFKKLIQDMKNAKTEPSAQCAGGKKHEFKFMMHADGTESFSNYFKCDQCEEIIVVRQQRTERDKAYWK